MEKLSLGSSEGFGHPGHHRLLFTTTSLPGTGAHLLFLFPSTSNSQAKLRPVSIPTPVPHHVLVGAPRGPLTRILLVPKLSVSVALQ